MSITATALSEHRLHPAARLSRPVRAAAAATVILGTGLQAASWLVYAQPDLVAAYSDVRAGAVRPDLSLELNVIATPF